MTRTVRELAEYLSCQVRGDSNATITGVASPARASATDLIYLDSPKHEERVLQSAARCVLARAGAALQGKTILETATPKLAFAKAASWLSVKLAPRGSIHPTAVVASDAKLGPGAFVGPYAVVEADAEIGAGTVVDAFCFLGRSSHVGEHCRLHPRVTLYEGAQVGDRVEIHSGTVIGADGFGYVYGEGRHWKFPQIGGVEIGDDAEIGANTTIDRGSLECTRIGKGVKIDNLVQIAHNVEVGDDSVLAAQTGISGSSVLGQHVVVGGQVGIGDHCRVEDDAVLGGGAGVLSGKTIRRGQTVWGRPARPLDRFKKQYALVSRLSELAERIQKLENAKRSG